MIEDRYFIVITRDVDGGLSGLSRRQIAEDGTPFAGPWGLLTEAEAYAVAELWNTDDSNVSPAEVVEVYRYDRDPAWTEEYA